MLYYIMVVVVGIFFFFSSRRIVFTCPVLLFMLIYYFFILLFIDLFWVEGNLCVWQRGILSKVGGYQAIGFTMGTGGVRLDRSKNRKSREN